MAAQGDTSLKNMALSPATMGLGLGDQLQTQVNDELEQRKKAKLSPNAAGPLNPNSAGISAAVASLLGTQGPM